MSRTALGPPSSSRSSWSCCTCVPKATCGRRTTSRASSWTKSCSSRCCLMIEPLQSCFVMAIGSLAGSIALRRKPVKLAFNLGQTVLPIACAVWLVHAMGVTLTNAPSFQDALVGMLGALVVTTMSALLRQRRSSPSRAAAQFLPLFASIPDSVPSWVGAVTLGGVAAISVGAEPGSALLIIGLVIFVARAYALSVSELSARRQAERLQQAIARSAATPTRSWFGRPRRGGQGPARGRPRRDRRRRRPRPARAYSAPLVAWPAASGHRTGSAADRWDERDRATLGHPGRRRRRRAALRRTHRPPAHDHQLPERGRHRARHERADHLRQPGRRAHARRAPSDEEVLGHPIQDRLTLRHRRDPDRLRRAWSRSQFVAQDADATLGPPDGDTLDIAYSITPLRAEGAHVGAVLVLRDVTERRAFQDELTRRALHDELTGLPNRRLLLERLDHALARTSTHRPQPRPAVPRPRPLQAGQRLLRPPDRRQAADPGRQPAAVRALPPPTRSRGCPATSSSCSSRTSPRWRP